MGEVSEHSVKSRTFKRRKNNGPKNTSHIDNTAKKFQLTRFEISYEPYSFFHCCSKLAESKSWTEATEPLYRKIHVFTRRQQIEEGCDENNLNIPFKIFFSTL